MKNNLPRCSCCNSLLFCICVSCSSGKILIFNGIDFCSMSSGLVTFLSQLLRFFVISLFLGCLFRLSFLISLCLNLRISISLSLLSIGTRVDVFTQRSLNLAHSASKLAFLLLRVLNLTISEVLYFCAFLPFSVQTFLQLWHRT